MKRFTVLTIVMLLAGSILAFAGGGQEAETGETSEGAATGEMMAAGTYSESPMLAQRVQAGELPPVDERLPEEPLVIEPIDEIGQYGGTWKRMSTHYFWYLTNEMLVKRVPWTMEWVPNLATDWEESDDATTFTFHLRRGVKWSDGEPYTVQDIMFWYEDLVLNEEYTPGKPEWLMAGGEMAKLSAPDDYTLVIEFVAPKIGFIMNVANYGNGHSMTKHAKHHLSQFHPSYTSKEELDAVVKREGFDSWTQLMEVKVDERMNPDRPTIGPWKLTTDPKEQVQTAERNPYYWKVDPAGNQLPYIDDMIWQDISEDDVRVLRIISGEVDYELSTTRTSDFPVLTENEANGNYEVIQLARDGLNGAGIMMYVNQNYVGDEEIAELLRNADFRRGLSVAIDRPEVNEFTSLGLAPERQPLLAASHPAGSAELEKMYTEYDPQQAKEFLDKAGLTERDNDGYRKLPSGKTFLLVLAPRGTTGWRVDAGEIIKGHFEDVGIKTAVRPEEGSIWLEKSLGGNVMISIYGNSNGFQPMIRPQYIFPISNNSYWAPLNGLYYASNGEQGVEPTGLQAELLEIFEAAQNEPEEEARNELIRQSQVIHAENLFQIGVCGYAPLPFIKSNRFHNTPEKLQQLGFNDHYTFPEQYYISE